MSQRRSSHAGSSRSYPRTARINEALREVIAEELEVIGDERLDLFTVTGITTDPDLRHANVWYSTLAGHGDMDQVKLALAEYRVRLQAAVGRQVRLKRTPLLQFTPDPAIEQGQRIEQIIRSMPRTIDTPDSVPTDSVPTDSVPTDSVPTETGTIQSDATDAS